MKPLTIEPAPAEPVALLGTIICEEVKADGQRLFHKGHRLTEADLSVLARLPHPVHAAQLAPGEVHEDEAGLRLAHAVAGQGIDFDGPAQSRVNLVAAHKGLLRVDPAAVTELNLLEDVAIFTLPDRLAVLPGTVVAGAKITPVAVPGHVLAEAEAIARRAPVIEVKPFLPLRAGVLVAEDLMGRLRERFEAAMRRKLGWYGGSVLRFVETERNGAAVATAIDELFHDGADFILTGGGNTIDPLDPAYLALPQLGAEIVKYGAPTDPGSMFWLAYKDEAPIFNLSSCSMYSKSTVFDLLLPLTMAGERITQEDMAAIGYGGLLGRQMTWRFPPYEADGDHGADNA